MWLLPGGFQLSGEAGMWYSLESNKERCREDPDGGTRVVLWKGRAGEI